MTDELFDYFGKGSKKFEPLDDDLDLPEVSPKRKDDLSGASEAEPVKASAKPLDDAPEPVEAESSDDSDEADDAFAGFGAGLFDASTDELPPRKQVAKAKPASVAKTVVKEQSKPVANSTPVKAKPDTKPVDTKPVREAAASDQTEDSEDSEGGTWDFIAGVLGIGGKKAKVNEDTDKSNFSSKTTATNADAAPRKSTVSHKSPTKAADKALFQEPKPASEKAVDALFNTADDGLDLVGWGDDEAEEEPIAAKPAKAERPERSGRRRKPNPAEEDRVERGRPNKAKASMVDDAIDDDIDDEDENFIEFEVEELSPARGKSEAPSDDGPRRRRRPAHKTNEDDSVRSDAPRSRSRTRNDRSDRDDASSESRSGGRGRGRGRGRNQNQDRDQDDRSRKTVAKSDNDSGSSDWRDNKPEADSEQRNERSRGSRGRGRKRPERHERDSKPFEENLVDDELEISGFVDDGDDSDAEEAPKKSRRSRRPRSRSRGRSRNRDENDRDDSDQDSSADLNVDDLESSDIDLPDRESTGRSSSGRSRRGRNSRGDRDQNDNDRDRSDRNSESTPRRGRGRGSRDNRDRDDSQDENPVYAEVPTWDETIESMIESNIKNHESGAGRGRGGGGRSRGSTNRNGNSRNRR